MQGRSRKGEGDRFWESHILGTYLQQKGLWDWSYLVVVRGGQFGLGLTFGVLSFICIDPQDSDHEELMVKRELSTKNGACYIRCCLRGNVVPCHSFARSKKRQKIKKKKKKRKPATHAKTRRGLGWEVGELRVEGGSDRSEGGKPRPDSDMTPHSGGKVCA